jgi:LysM repeat protein
MMSNYAIYFDYDNKTYRLPVNPEELNKNSVQAIERYQILKLGQIAIPTHMELTEYNFEVEFPHEALHYVETSGNFKDSDYYLNLFSKWRNDLAHVRFIASNGIGDDINSLVLIEEVKEVEKAGEEGDKYISFKLLEYKKYGKKSVVVQQSGTAIASTAKVEVPVAVNPKSTGSYTVVSGDSLWAIAKKYYGDGSKYNKIVTANSIKNPNLIYPGQKLVIPS